jgi:glyoxylase-like metal-dependent hydrolase (beta-lactamase superfamily II)
MTVRVFVLKEGTIEREPDGTILDASSSVTLVLADDDTSIVVDTGMPQDADEIEGALAEHDLRPEDVDMVVNTHCHADHTGCNVLFTNATVVVHREEGAARSMSGKVLRVEGTMEELAPGVRVIYTPGHSRGSISVVAETDLGTWVMAGDALPTPDNYVAWVPPGINYDPEVALASMKRIVDLADTIVPGHGPPFKKDGQLPTSVMHAFYAG